MGRSVIVDWTISDGGVVGVAEPPWVRNSGVVKFLAARFVSNIIASQCSKGNSEEVQCDEFYDDLLRLAKALYYDAVSRDTPLGPRRGIVARPESS